MIVAIVGSRNFIDYDFFIDNLPSLSFAKIISGGAKGADSLAKRYAIENNIDFTEYLADWKKHGMSAGPIRNAIIVENAECMVAFWDGKSTGTKNAISLAKKKRIPLLIIPVKHVIDSL